MRILHTADWHLNDRLGRIDRTADLRRAVERVAGLCRDESVDLMIVAGDLFSEMSRPEGLRESIQHWRDTFGPFLAGGGTIVAITGNHDNDQFCRTLCLAMDLAAPPPPGGVSSGGRFHLASEPGLLRVGCPRDGTLAQFVLMPYPTPAKYLPADGPRRFDSLEQRNAAVHAGARDWLAGVRESPRFDPSLATVLVGHLTVRTAGMGALGLFRLSESEDVVFDEADLTAGFAYGALGHIHKPQTLGGRATLRYSGSFERMDLGEALDRKGVVLFDMGDSGLDDDPRFVELDATPVYEVTIRDPDTELPLFESRYVDRHTALVNVHLHYTAGTHHLEGLLREIDRVFPRWYARDWTESAALGATLAAGTAAPTRSFRQTVTDYLEGEMQNHDADERAAVLRLADALLEEERT